MRFRESVGNGNWGGGDVVHIFSSPGGGGPQTGAEGDKGKNFLKQRRERGYA